MKSNSGLVLFTRRPRLGQGKTRFAQGSSDKLALDVSEVLLESAGELLLQWNTGGWGRAFLCIEKKEDAPWFQKRFPGVDLLIQSNGNLGEKLLACHRDCRKFVTGSILIMGSDAPLLNLADICDLQNQMEKEAVLKSGRFPEEGLYQEVFGFIPAEDGGFVLMGTNGEWPDLKNLPWSTSEIMNSLERLIFRKYPAARVLYGEQTLDIDAPSDLLRAEELLVRGRKKFLQICKNLRENLHD
jgi:glycosyltransferase A (GT-A) superfamily protein (DUF2064 family)